MDAAEAAVRSLEDNSAFNAGRGAVLTEAGTVECDAVIVDGTNRKTGIRRNIYSSNDKKCTLSIYLITSKKL